MKVLILASNIKENGNMKISNEKTPRNKSPENVICPQILVDKFKSANKGKSLHLDIFAKLCGIRPQKAIKL